MKTALLLIVLIGIINHLEAQDPSLKVSASAGNSYETNNLIFDWTLGEVLINTIENGSAIISQGMHQPVYMTTPVHTIPANLGTIGIYPNPATDYVNIDVELKSPSVFDVTMTNATGRLLWSKKYSGQIITSSCGLTEFVQGTYFITIRLKGTDIFQTFQVVKIN